MTPLAAFGLPAEADERAIKREYAKRLKTVRPDEDPDGFQRLHALYQQALQFIEQRARGVLQRVVEPAPEPVPAPAREAITFDFDAFYNQMLALGTPRDAGAGDMRAFLLGNEALWHLGLKRAVAETCIRRLWEDKPSLSPSSFDALAGFFDEWSVDRGRDLYGVMPLRRELQEKHFGFSELRAPQPKTYGDGHRMLIGVAIFLLVLLALANRLGEPPAQEFTIDRDALPAAQREPVDYDKLIAKPAWVTQPASGRTTQ